MYVGVALNFWYPLMTLLTASRKSFSVTCEGVGGGHVCDCGGTYHLCEARAHRWVMGPCQLRPGLPGARHAGQGMPTYVRLTAHMCYPQPVG